ncbi:response regulator [bacterium]|nr:MAG: response regulator [bacterium]
MDYTDIILIEDNLQDVEMILDAFKEHRMIYKIRVLNDGAGALDYFFGPQGCIYEAATQLPQLILLDLNLPKVNGLDVLKHLKSYEQTRQIPVAVFTSSNEDLSRQCYALGADSYMVKPLDSELFSRCVADIGSRLSG